jgi:hypothetical protein
MKAITNSTNQPERVLAKFRRLAQIASEKLSDGTLDLVCHALSEVIFRECGGHVEGLFVQGTMPRQYPRLSGNVLEKLVKAVQLRFDVRLSQIGPAERPVLMRKLADELKEWASRCDPFLEAVAEGERRARTRQHKRPTGKFYEGSSDNEWCILGL